MGLPEFLQLLDQGADPQAIPYTTLAELSGITTDEAQELLEHLAYWPEDRVQGFFSRLAEMVEGDVRMEFEGIFLRGLDSDDSRTRTVCVMGLSESTHPSLVRRFSSILQGDESEDVRIAAALGMARLATLAHEGKLTQGQSQQLKTTLTESFNDELESVAVRRRVLEALAVFQDEVVQAYIEIAYEDEDPEMRQSALHAMGRNCSERWLEHILPELDSYNPANRYEATLALGQIGDESYVQPLTRMLDDEDLEVQVAAVTSLGIIGGRQATRLLRGLLSSAEPAVAHAASEALHNIEVEDMTIMDYQPQSETEVRATGRQESLEEDYEDDELYLDDIDLAEAGFKSPGYGGGDGMEWFEGEDEWEDASFVITDEDIGPLTDDDYEDDDSYR